MTPGTVKAGQAFFETKMDLGLSASLADAETTTLATSIGGNTVFNYASPNSGIGGTDASGAPAGATSSASTAIPGVNVAPGSSSGGIPWLLIGGLAVLGLAAWYFLKHKPAVRA